MHLEYSAITISIPKVKVSHFEKDTYLYEIDIATRWAKWHLEKKYSQFQDLHEYLKKEFNDLPEFPSSILGYFMGETDDDIADYKDGLEEYLQGTSLRMDIVNSEYYSEFLQLPQHSKSMLVNKPTFDGEFQLENRTEDDSKVIVDFYHNEDYFVFATGNNSPLEKFNAVLANTKFPWEDEEDAEFILPLGTVECWICKKKPYKYSRIWARNYPTEVTKMLFNPVTEIMVVGLADGSIQFFNLYARGRNIYYEVIKLVRVHEEAIVSLHLDSVNMIVYSASSDGWLNTFETKNGVLINTQEFGSEITCMHGDEQNMRLFVAFADGNVNIISYNSKAKTKILTTLCTPETGSIVCMKDDKVKNYLFLGGHETGNIFVYDIGKPGQEKLAKQIGFMKNKEQIIDFHWRPEKMELIVTTETGEVFFWNCVKGKQIYMLKAMEEIAVSHYVPESHTLITASKEKLVKFWEIPTVWRDMSAEIEEEKEIQIRRKVDNLHRVREAVKKKEEDSDEDDIACWYMSDSSDEEEESWINFDF